METTPMSLWLSMLGNLSLASVICYSYCTWTMWAQSTICENVVSLKKPAVQCFYTKCCCTLNLTWKVVLFISPDVNLFCIAAGLFLCQHVQRSAPLALQLELWWGSRSRKGYADGLLDCWRELRTMTSAIFSSLSLEFVQKYAYYVPQHLL